MARHDVTAPERDARLMPQPEHEEPRLEDPGVRDLSRRDRIAIFLRAFRGARRNQVSTSAKAVAYSLFLVIPSGLLVALGLWSRVSSPDDVPGLLAHLNGLVPGSAIDLLDQSMKQLTRSSGGGLMVVVGLVLAVWALIGAMQSMMWALNTTYERRERRGFVRQRIAALGMVICILVAVAMVVGLLVLGPELSGWAGRQLGQQTVVAWVWWVAEWPLLLLVLLAAFAGIYYLGPDVDHPRFRFITPGAVFAVIVWLAISGGFSWYAASLGSYNKTWGSLATVIVMLTWLWLSALALLIGAEINAEAERSRELRTGEPAADVIQAPAKT
jgi:membrane protein